MSSKTAYQIFYDEQQKLAKNSSSSSSSHIQIQKEIGNKWRLLTIDERAHYVNKKNQSDEQFLKEQLVMKNNRTLRRDNPPLQSDVPILKKTTVQASPEFQQDNAKNLRFTKDDLQRQKVDTTNKIVVKTTQSQIEQGMSKQKQLPSKEVSDLQDHSNHKTYLDFYKGQFAKYKQLFPKRSGVELTTIIKQEWQLMQLGSKLRQKNQKQLLKNPKQPYKNSKKGFVLINEKEVEIPVRPISGYLRYYQKNFQQFKEENPTLKPQEMTIIAGNKWKNLTEDQKEEFNSLYRKEDAEYQKQKLAFISKYSFLPPSTSQNSSKPPHNPTNKSKNHILINGVPIKHPVKLSGYYLFEKTLRGELEKQTHKMSSKELSTFIGQQWKNFPASKKEQYEAEQEKIYLSEKKLFIQKHGMFPEPALKKQKIQATITKQSEKSAQNNINSKRRPLPPLSEEDQEALLLKKHARKMQINYDDVESEVDDIMSLINEDIKDKTTKTNLNKKVSSTQNHLRNKIIQQQMQSSTRNYTNSEMNKQSTFKSNNSLFDMLNQPIQISGFAFAPNFF